MQKYDYTSVDTIFAKFSRDLRGTDLHESDVIEWIGEALGFLKIAEMHEEAIAFLEVKNHVVEVPTNFHAVIQVAKYNNWQGPREDICPGKIIQSIVEPSTYEPGCCESEVKIDRSYAISDCNGNIINEDDIYYFRPKFDFKFEYYGWTRSRKYAQSYTPIRLANHSFFNSVVCKETGNAMSSLYSGVQDEYSPIAGRPIRQLRFSFKEGYVALAYLRSMIDEETGYPLIPDDIAHITAITYYIKWKLAERLRWDGREGFAQEAQDAEQHWLKYVRQAINKTKMPSGVDQYQNMMEQSMYLIPRLHKYHNFFFTLGREEDRAFNNPNYTGSSVPDRNNGIHESNNQCFLPSFNDNNNSNDVTIITNTIQQDNWDSTEW